MKILLLLVWSSVTLIKGNSQLISWDTELNHKETLSNGFCKIQDSKKDHLLITSNEEIVQSFRCKRDTNRFGRKGPSDRQRSGARFDRPRGRARQSFQNQGRGGGFFENRGNDHGALKGKFRERYGDNHRPYDHHGGDGNRNKDRFDDGRPYGNRRDDQRAYGGQNDDRRSYRDRDNDRGPYRGGRGGERRPNQDRGGDQKPYQGRDRDSRLQQGSGGDWRRPYQDRGGYLGPYQKRENFHLFNLSAGEQFKRFSELPSHEKCIYFLDLHSEWKKEKQRYSLEKQRYALEKQKYALEKQRYANERKERMKERKQRMKERKQRMKERKQRLKLEAQFDFVELIKALVKTCYPKWAKPRQEDDFSPAVWHKVLLNIESYRVIQIRQQMKQDHVTEEEFISVMEDIMLGRNPNVHYRVLTDPQRAEAYPEWLATATSSHKTVIAGLLKFSYKVEGERVIPFELCPSTTSTISPKDSELISDVIQEAKQNRSHLNLLMTDGEPFLSSISEQDLEKKLEKFDIRVCYKFSDNNTFLLFKNFDDAYAAMQHLKNNVANGEFRIKSISDYELHPNLKQDSILKVEPGQQQSQSRKSSRKTQKSGTTQTGETTTSAAELLSNKLQSIVQSKFSLKRAKFIFLTLTNLVFVKGETLEHTLMAYKLLKKELNSGELLSIVSEESVNIWMTHSANTIMYNVIPNFD